MVGIERSKDNGTMYIKKSRGGGSTIKVLLDITKGIDELEYFQSGYNYNAIGVNKQDDGSYSFRMTTAGTGGNCIGFRIPTGYKGFIMKFRDMSLTSNGSVTIRANCVVNSSSNSPQGGSRVTYINGQASNLYSTGWYGDDAGDTIGLGMAANGATSYITLEYLALFK